MANDFYVEFGSNAYEFVERTKRQLKPLKEEISFIKSAMQAIDSGGGAQVQRFREILHSTVPNQGAGGGGDGQGVDLRALQSLDASLDSIKSELSGVLKVMKKAADNMEAATKKQLQFANRQYGQTGRLDEGQGNYVHPTTGRVLGNRKLGISNEAEAAMTPGAYRMQRGSGGAVDQGLAAQVSAALAKYSQGQGRETTIREVTQVQLDEGAIINAIKGVEAAIDRLAAKGIPVSTGVQAAEGGTTTVAATATAAAKKKKGGKKSIQDEVAEVVERVTGDIPASRSAMEARITEMRRGLADIEQQNRSLVAILEQGGVVISDGIRQSLEKQQARATALRAEIAKAEREMGTTRAEQKKARQAEFRSGPDLDEAEYDRRMDIRRKLDLAAVPEAFMQAASTKGKGSLSKTELVQFAKELNTLGFATRISGTKEELAKGILESREAFGARYGTDLPDELRTGKRVVATKVSDAVRDMVGDINQAAADAAEEEAARNQMRLAYLSGALPKDPAEALPEGADRFIGNSAITVPRGMVKGGSFTDEYGVLSDPDAKFGMGPHGIPIGALQFLRDRAFGKAVVKAANPDFDPFAISGDEIQGTDQFAQNARLALRGLRAATAELDGLGTEYKALADGLAMNEEYVERAIDRMRRARGAGLPVGQKEWEEHDANIQAQTDEELASLKQSYIDAGKRIGGTIEEQEAFWANQRNLIERNVKDRFFSEERLDDASIRYQDVEKLRDDPSKVLAAQEQMERLRSQMESGRFRGIQDLLESPEYQEGLANRNTTREIQRLQSEQRGRLQYIEGTVSTRGAMEQAIVGTQLAAGTKGTYIRKLPDAKYNPYESRYEWVDPDRDPRPLQKLNKFSNEYNAGLRREQRMAEEVRRGDIPMEDLERQQEKTEKAAINFLKQIEAVFGEGIGPSLRQILNTTQNKEEITSVDAEGQPISRKLERWEINRNLSPEGEEFEAGRLDRMRRMQEITNAKTTGTKEQKARASLAEAQHRLAQATKKQAEQSEELAQLGAQLESTYEALNPKEKALVAAADARLKRLQSERNALENAWFQKPDESTIGKVEEVGTQNRDQVDAKINSHKEAVARLREEEAQAREAVNEAEAKFSGNLDSFFDSPEGKGGAPQFSADQEAKLAALAEESAQAQARLTKASNDLAEAEGTLATLTEWREESLRQAGVADEDRTRLANEYRDKNHHHSEALDVMGYPTALGYNEDREKAAKRLDEEIEKARSERARVVGGGDERAELVAELARRKADRDAISKRIGAAADEGDLKENAGYHAAKEEQGRNEARIKAIENRLASVGMEKYEQLADQLERTNKVIAGLTQDVEKAEEKLRKAGGKPKASAQVRAEESSAEAQALGAEIGQATKLRRDATDLRNKKKAAAAEEKAAIQAQIDALKADPNWRSRSALQEMRKRYQSMVAGGDGAGVGGPPAPPGTPPTGGGGRGDGSTNSILRDILAAINGIHRTLQTGVKTTGGAAVQQVDAEGNPVPRKPRATRANIASAQELANARSGDPEREALAAAAQQRRLEQFMSRESNLGRAQGQAIEEDARRSNITRAQAHEQMQLAKAMGLVSTEARKELAELKRLTQAGADNTKIAEQQAKALAAVNSSLAAGGVSRADDRRVLGTSLLSDASGGKVDRQLYDQISRSARSINGFQVVDQAMADGVMPGGIFGEQSAFTQAMFGNRGFWGRIMGSTGAFIVRNFAAGFVFGMTNALQEVIMQAIQTEATFVRVSHALEATGRDVGSLRTDLQGISTEYGVALNDVYQTAAGLTGLFDTTEEIAGATRVVAQLQMISAGALNAQEAMGALASIQGAFQSELGRGLEGLQHVADVLTSVQNNVGTNVEVTAEAVGRMSGLAHQLGLSFEEVAVYGAQIAKLTNQTGAAAGEQFSRILAGVQTGRGRAALQGAFGDEMSAALGDRDYSTILRQLISGWDDLSESQKSNLATTIAGQRQAAAFAALMRNGEKTLEAVTRAQNSYGDAQDRTEKLMNTLNAQVNKLGSNLQNLASALVRTGILNFLGLTLKAINAALGGVNTLLSVLNDFADSNPILSFIKDVGFGIIGLVLAVSLLQRTFRGLKATLQNLPGVQAFTGQDQEGRPTLGQRAGAAVQRGTDRLVGVDRGVVNPNNAMARAVGAGVERFVVRPLEGVGRSATRFGAALDRSRHALIAQANALGATTGVAAPGYVRAAELRASRTGQVGSAFAGFGGGMQRFAGDLRGWTNPAQRFSDLAAQRRQQATIRGFDAQNLASQGAMGGSRWQMLQAGSMQSMSRASDLAARANDRVSSGLKRMAATGVGADAAMAGVAMAITALIVSAQDDAQAASALADIMDARRKKRGGDEGSQGDEFDVSLSGVAGERYSEITRKFTEEGTAFEAGLSMIGAGLGDIFTGRMDKVLSGRTFEEATGTKDGKLYGMDEVQGLYDKQLQNLEAVAAMPGATAKDLEKASKETSKKFNQMANEVANNKELSKQQAVAQQALIEQAEDNFRAQYEAKLAASRGMASAGLLETDQIARLSDISTLLPGLQQSPALMNQFRGGIEALVGEAGIDKNNPEIKAAMAKLAQGGLSTAESMVQTNVILREQARQAQIKYESVLANGENEEGELDTKRADFINAMNALAQATVNTIQQFATDAQLIAEAAFRLGDFEGGRQAIEDAIAAIEAEVPDVQGPGSPKLTPAQQEMQNRKRALQGQLGDMLLQEDISVSNFGLQKQAARGQGEVAAARNTLRQEQNARNKMLDAARANEAGAPSADQIRQQQIRVIEAKTRMASVLGSQDVANAMLAAAGIWNETAAQAAREEVAAAQLAAAIDQFGKGSNEAKAARASLKNEEMAGVSLADQQAQAARDAAAAAIPQGDAVAVAQAGVRNAQAALAAAEKYGTNSTQYQGALAQLASAQQQAQAAQASVTQAQAQLAQAYADARGDAVASARAGVAVARAALQAALQASGGARSAEVIGAQAQLVAASAAVDQAQADLVASKVSVSIAIAEAAGHTVMAANLQLRQARIALAFARRRSGGEATAEVNAARAQMIQAQAAARDAALQDQLDTIDFNLEMGKITQSSAISALREILRTSDLTKEQRRNLLLQIKGMQEELSSSPWNFGDIKMPKPYELRRYMAAEREARTARLDSMVGKEALGGGANRGGEGGTTTISNQTTIQIDGADVAKVRRIVEEVVGKGGRTRTVQHRRR